MALCGFRGGSLGGRSLFAQQDAHTTVLRCYYVYVEYTLYISVVYTAGTTIWREVIFLWVYIKLGRERNFEMNEEKHTGTVFAKSVRQSWRKLLMVSYIINGQFVKNQSPSHIYKHRGTHFSQL